MDKGYCIYLLKFEGYRGERITTNNPLIKVGICYGDAQFRIRNNSLIANQERTDDIPWKNLFQSVTILEQIIGLTEDKAREMENKILSKWGIKDFLMKEYVSGISEFRIYNLDREVIAKQLLYMLL